VPAAQPVPHSHVLNVRDLYALRRKHDSLQQVNAVHSDSHVSVVDSATTAGTVPFSELPHNSSRLQRHQVQSQQRASHNSRLQTTIR
jgi:hypothetical protein